VQWIFGALIVGVGLTLIIAGAQGSGNSLYEAVTGKTPKGSASTSATASAISSALSNQSPTTLAPVASSGFAGTVTSQGGGQPLAA
jgi:hypothetical protein